MPAFSPYAAACSLSNTLAHIIGVKLSIINTLVSKAISNILRKSGKNVRLNYANALPYICQTVGIGVESPAFATPFLNANLKN